GKLYAIVGNYFSLFSRESPSGWRTHMGLEGRGFFTMRSESSRFPLETVDGMVGVYLEGARNAFQWQFRYTHLSAHLADGLPNVQPQAFSRETLSLRLGYVPNLETHVYGGAHYIANSF